MTAPGAVPRAPISHKPVLLAEVLEALKPGPGRTLVDGTFGAGGYSRAFLAAGASVVAFDRDPAAAHFAAALDGTAPFKLITASFSTMTEVTGEGAADGVALDLGVSSMQLDEAERGFSFLRDGPLHIRNSGEGATAADLVNTAEPAVLAGLFRRFGEERAARRIAAVVARRRAVTPFLRTGDLAHVVETALGGRRGAKIHPATRVFQALRIAVNDELGELETGLSAAERTLRPGGALAVVTFHSLEDRIVKTFLASRSGLGRTVSRHAPPLAAGPAPSFTLVQRGVRSAESGRDRRQSTRQISQTALGRAHRFAGLEARRMIFSGVFNQRYRGFRLIDLAALGLVLALALGSYVFTTLAGAEKADTAGVEVQIAQERTRIRLLRAELAHLEDPGRIERLSTQYLGMTPADPKHETTPEALAQVAVAGAANPASAKSPQARHGEAKTADSSASGAQAEAVKSAEART